jgi:hypothetical protein
LCHGAERLIRGAVEVTIQELGSIGEFVAAIATIATLAYLAIQIRSSNRLARAEASRSPNSDLNSLNASFGTNPAFLAAVRQVLSGATRDELEPVERTLLDYYLISLTNIQEQLAREIREGILDSDALDFGGAGFFSLPYYRTSWPIYRGYLSSVFVEDFEKRYDLDPSIEAVI